jgi:DNA-binding PadR family transcriptional regulator
MKVKDRENRGDGESDRPISAAALHILLALTESNLHGYGIMQAVKRQSGGDFKLGPGTLYANLDRLLANGLVGESERKLKNKDGETRREYFLTPSGERVLRAEILRLRQMVELARTRLGKLGEKGA